MVAYDPKDWFSFIFRFHQSDTFRKLWPLLIAVSVYSGIIGYVELSYWSLSENPYLKNLTLLHNLLGFVLSLLLVFRTNTAYDRWWEGRKAWGTLTNTSRNLAIALNGILKPGDHANRSFFKSIIPLFADALVKHLSAETTRLALDPEAHADIPELDHAKHLPNQVAALIQQRTSRLLHEGLIRQEEYLAISPLILTLTDVSGICERIKNTPIPFSYSAFLKKFIFFYVMTLPFGFVFSLGYYVIPVAAFVLYVLASLELIAEEIEDPFGKDTNDLPTDRIAANIRKHVGEIL